MLIDRLNINNWLTDWSIHSFIHSFISVTINRIWSTGRCSTWQLHTLTFIIYWLVGWLIDWLIDWLTDWLIGWLIEWLVDHSTDWLIHWPISIIKKACTLEDPTISPSHTLALFRNAPKSHSGCMHLTKYTKAPCVRAAVMTVISFLQLTNPPAQVQMAHWEGFQVFSRIIIPLSSLHTPWQNKVFINNHNSKEIRVWYLFNPSPCAQTLLKQSDIVAKMFIIINRL